MKPVTEFLNKKSKDQVELMNYAVYNEYGQLPEESDPETIQKKIQDSKAATKALRHLFDLFMYSYEKAVEKAKTMEGGKIEPGDLHANNIIACLLYWDGISMVNIDIVKLIENNANYTGMNLKDFIFTKHTLIRRQSFCRSRCKCPWMIYHLAIYHLPFYALAGRRCPELLR